MLVMEPPPPVESLENCRAMSETNFLESSCSLFSSSCLVMSLGMVVTTSLTLSITGWFMIVVLLVVAICFVGGACGELVEPVVTGVSFATYIVSGSDVKRFAMGE